jgi:hypothetical protein
MKYVKMLGLLAVAAAALMAFVGTASATTITSSAGATPTIEAESTNGKLHGAFITVECSKSTVKGAVEQHGAGVTAKGNISNLTFTGCNYATTVIKAGSLEVHGTSTTGNGTLTSTGAEIKIHTSVGECIFTTSATDIGTLTGSNVTKGNAVLDIASSSIPRTGGSFFCGSSGTWTGTYTVTAPSTLEVH